MPPTVRRLLQGANCAPEALGLVMRKAGRRQVASGVDERRSMACPSSGSSASSRIASWTRAQRSASCLRHFSWAARIASESWEISACAPETSARSSRARCLQNSLGSGCGMEGVWLPSNASMRGAALTSGAARHVGNCGGVPMLPRLPGVGVGVRRDGLDEDVGAAVVRLPGVSARCG